MSVQGAVYEVGELADARVAVRDAVGGQKLLQLVPQLLGVGLSQSGRARGTKWVGWGGAVAALGGVHNSKSATTATL